MGRTMFTALAAGTIAVAGLVVAGYYGSGPLAELVGVEVTTHQAVAGATLGEGSDPSVVDIAVTWPAEGYCSGQLQVTAVESATEVRVGDVVSRVRRAGGSCAGLGTVDGLAWAPLQLAAPLAQRRLVRDSDGSVLPLERR